MMLSLQTSVESPRGVPVGRGGNLGLRKGCRVAQACLVSSQFLC